MRCGCSGWRNSRRGAPDAQARPRGKPIATPSDPFFPEGVDEMKIRSRLLVIAVLVTICAWAWTAQGQRQATTSIQWESTPLPTKKKHTLRVTKMSDKRIASQLRLGLHLA